MANEPSHSPLAPEPSDRKILVSAFAWVGVILIFVFIVYVAYVPNRARDLNEANAQQRTEIRLNVDATQEKIATTYGWVNEADGIVRVPTERAKELVLKELRAAQSSD